MASIVGMLCFLHLALDDVVHLKTKYMKKAISTAISWEQTMHMDRNEADEILFGTTIFLN